MSSGLILVLVVAGAYLAAHVVFEWLAARFLVVSGTEYLILGILAGPQVTGIIGPGTLDDFAPLMTLALGWMGMMVGTGVHVRRMLRIPRVCYRIAAEESVLSFATVTALAGLALAWTFDLPWRDAVAPAVALGAVATASAPSGLLVVGKQLGWRGPVMAQIGTASTLRGILAVSAFGLLLCAVHPAPTTTGWRPPTTTEWAAISVGIGAVGGALFHLFLGREQDPDRLFVALSGAIIVTSGAAAYLDLSPLLPALLMGIILINTSPNSERLRDALARVERPFYLVLLIFAGAAWVPPSGTWSAWALPVALFLIARMGANVGAARLATRANGMLGVLGPHWGRALLGQGELALAIGLNYQLLEFAVLPGLVFTATVASVLLTHLSSARLVRSVARNDRRLFVTTGVGEAPQPGRPEPTAS